MTNNHNGVMSGRGSVKIISWNVGLVVIFFESVEYSSVYSDHSPVVLDLQFEAQHGESRTWSKHINQSIGFLWKPTRMNTLVHPCYGKR